MLDLLKASGRFYPKIAFREDLSFEMQQAAHLQQVS